MELTAAIKQVLRDNICYFATTSENNKPNVVPVGLVEPVNDSEVLLVDVLFNKTRKNLQENPQVAPAVTDMNRLQAYQLKGRAQIITSGELFDKALLVFQEKSARRNEKMTERLEKTKDPQLKSRCQKMIARHKELTPKAAVVITISEVYPTM